MPSWRDEKHLWDYLRLRLRGTWMRLEAAVPEGLPDTLGLWDRETHWLELKVGKPSVDALRVPQRAFAMSCAAHDVSWHVCFGHRSNAWFYTWPGLLRLEPHEPDFWVPPIESLRLARQHAVGKA